MNIYTLINKSNITNKVHKPNRIPLVMCSISVKNYQCVTQNNISIQGYEK